MFPESVPVSLFVWFLVMAALAIDWSGLVKKCRKGTDKQLAWVALALAVVNIGIKYIVPLLRRRRYTPGGYELGALYRRNVLGENLPNTDNDLKVGDTAAYLARYIFTAGFGIPVTNRYMYVKMILPGDYNGYRVMIKEAYGIDVPKEAFDRAHTLAKLYFPDQAVPPKFVWDLSKFDALPYVVKIVSPDNPKQLMNVDIEGELTVKDGVIVRPDKFLVEQVIAEQNKPGQVMVDEGNKWLIWAGAAAAGVGLWYFTKNKKRK